MMEVHQEDEFQRTLDMKRVMSYNGDEDGRDNNADNDGNEYNDPDLLYIDTDGAAGGNSRNNGGDRLNQRLLLNRIRGSSRFVKAGKKALLSAHDQRGASEDEEDSDMQPMFEEVSFES